MEIKHGTLGAYNNHKCHCDLCRKAQRDYMRAYRAGIRKRSQKITVDWNRESGPTDRLAMCGNCHSFFTYRETGSFRCRECGYHDGDHHLVLDFAISDLFGGSDA